MSQFRATISTRSHFAEITLQADSPSAALRAARLLSEDEAALNALDWQVYDVAMSDIDTISIANGDGYIIAEWEREALERGLAAGDALALLAAALGAEMQANGAIGLGDDARRCLAQVNMLLKTAVPAAKIDAADTPAAGPRALRH